jgi:hypothetical protein
MTAAQARAELLRVLEESECRDVYEGCVKAIARTGLKTPPSDEILRLAIQCRKLNEKTECDNRHQFCRIMEDVAKGLNTLALLCILMEDM